ncbi:hypothetical protein [Butyricimonas paravirosa]|uniref:hypothetical protein n=1 Tax=Butyricimonas paravirosa TaxID=1472417 RepID=UPI0026E06831|nr:hypothetical protein [Butyricimonas paravirosa]
MKVKITRIVLIIEDGSKTTIKPNKIVGDVESYRRLQKEANNASRVLFVIEEIE